MFERVLCVDDEEKVLRGIKRELMDDFNIEIANSGEKGLEVLAQSGPFAVVVSDLRMPGMDGIQFLSKVKEAAPDTVRIMLTGNADVSSAVEAVNEGNIFRFLTKPCPSSILSKAIVAGIEYYRLVHAEKELMEKTLKGSIKILTDMLSMVKPTAFGRASRVRRLTERLARELKCERMWEIEIAAMLSQIGCITVPEQTLSRAFKGLELKPQEKLMFTKHPEVGQDIISNIPRLNEVADIIAYQEKRFDGSGFPNSRRSGNDIPLGARILKLALDYDVLISSGMDEKNAMQQIVLRGNECYDPKVIFALKNVMNVGKEYETIMVKINELKTNMVFAEDVKGESGVVVIAKGQEVTPSLIIRMKNYSMIAGIREPLKVIVQINDPDIPSSR